MQCGDLNFVCGLFESRLWIQTQKVRQVNSMTTLRYVRIFWSFQDVVISLSLFCGSGHENWYLWWVCYALTWWMAWKCIDEVDTFWLDTYFWLCRFCVFKGSWHAGSMQSGSFFSWRWCRCVFSSGNCLIDVIIYLFVILSPLEFSIIGSRFICL